MTETEAFERVALIVRRELGLGATQPIEAHTDLDSLGADSLDVIEIVMEMEKAFGRELVEWDLPEFPRITIGSLVHLVHPQP